MPAFDPERHPRDEQGKFDVAGAVASWVAKRAAAGEESAIKVTRGAYIEGKGYMGVRKDLIHEVHEFSGEHGLKAVVYRADGIRVYKYTEKHDQQQADKKFARAERMGQLMDKARDQMHRDLGSSDPKTRQLAAVATTIDQHCIRMGGSVHEERTGSTGVSTLRVEHVSQREDGTHLGYTGKSGVDADKHITDPALARSLTEHAAGKAPGERLFSVKPQEVNAYLKQTVGAKITAKDFRTFTASRRTADGLAKLPPPKNMREARANIKAVVAAVAKHLDHTVGVCKSKYINPRIPNEYLARVPKGEK